MNRDLLIGAFIGGIIGSAIGGWIHKSKSIYDADLVAYQNMAPTPEPTSPTATATTGIPSGYCICPTPTKTSVPLTEKEIAANKDWYKLEAAEINSHAKDFVTMPHPQAMYHGVPVEFFTSGPREWVSDMPSQDGEDHDSNDKPQKSEYEKFYGIDEDKDQTMVNGFKRGKIFDSWLEDGEFASLHKPFYGMKSFYKYCNSPGCGSRPSPRWIYCVWSVKYKSPIPFAYPSEAIKLVERQGKKK